MVVSQDGWHHHAWMAAEGPVWGGVGLTLGLRGGHHDLD